MFNIRVYGILINKQRQLMLTTEQYQGRRFTKFPGGGLEHGEGTIDCLKREFLEEFDCHIHIEEHFYTTDFFQPSAFNPNQQVVSIYYKVKCVDSSFIFHNNYNDFYVNFIDLEKISDSMVTFPIDKYVIKILQSQINK